MYKVALLFFWLFVAVFAQYGDEKHHIVDFYAKPEYKFEYSVHDPHTHDIKKQEESREGKLVKGSYGFLEADGKNHRNVHYVIESHLKKVHY